MDSTLLQYSFQAVHYLLIIFPTLYYTRIISHSNVLNTPLVLILGLSTNFQINFPLLLYAYHLTEQWTQRSSSTHSRSVYYFPIIFPTLYYTRIISQSNGLNTPLVLILGLSTISQSYFLLFTIRVSSHRAMDSTLLQYSFQVCPLFLNHISYSLLYKYHLTEQWTQHSTGTYSRSVHYFLIIFPTFTIRVSPHTAMDSTLLQYSFQVCPLFLNHILPLLLYAYHLTQQWTQHSSSTHSRSVYYFSIIFPTLHYTRFISQSNGLNTPLVLILGLSTISQSYFLLFTKRVSSHRAMDSTLLQYSFQVCPLFLNHISYYLLYAYHLTEHWTQHSSSTYSRSVHYILIILPAFTIRVSSHTAMDSTLLQY